MFLRVERPVPGRTAVEVLIELPVADGAAGEVNVIRCAGGDRPVGATRTGRRLCLGGHRGERVPSRYRVGLMSLRIAESE